MTPENRRIVYAFIFGILKRMGCHVYRINGVSDHLHIVLSIPPKVCIADLIRDIKSKSSLKIRRDRLFADWSGWQRGYFLASYAAESRPALIRYVIKQQKHHGETTAPQAEDYGEELRRLLNEQGINWDEAYLD